MFNGKCVVSGDEPQTSLTFEIVTDGGDVIDFEKSFETPAEAEEHAEFVADLLPLKDVVGPTEIGKAKEIIKMYANPSTQIAGEAMIDDALTRSAVDDSARDTVYAVKRLSDSISGSWFKKARSKMRKRYKKGAKRPSGPAASFDPRKVEAMTRLVSLPPQDAQAIIRDSSTGEPAPLEKVEEIQENTARALASLQQTSPDSFEEIPDDYYGEDVGNEEEEIGFALPMPLRGIYRAGAAIGDEGQDDWEVGKGLFGNLFKKLGKVASAFDPTKKGSITGGLIKSIPGIGPGIMAAADTLAKARAGVKKEVDKIKTVKELASAGVPGAQKAVQNLKTAQNLQNQIEKEVVSEVNPPAKGWFPFHTYHWLGAKS